MGDESTPNGHAEMNAEDQWIQIQAKTFTNWVNEQLSVSGRSVNNITVDLCDGVKLVALVEALQFQKIGKVYTNPSSRIQQLQNVSLAFKAITSDNVKLVNLGAEDVVNGNGKLILGLIWHLIQRYQISGKKTKAPPKKLMLMWFRTNLPDLDITNFKNDWNDGIALHALLELLKPGTSPNWRQLHGKDRVENCRRAMVLAKEQLNIPRVIHPEDFASNALDDLSAMTYLSYFVKMESPGYYNTLNWVCKLLRTTNITNLTTDWNDGYLICAVVQSLGGDIPGWPNLDRSKKVENCQKGIDAAKELGIAPLLNGTEMADPNVDHLTMMTYLSKLQHLKPKKSKSEKLRVVFNGDNIRVGSQGEFYIFPEDSDVVKDKVKIKLKFKGANDVDFDYSWQGKKARGLFYPEDPGEHKLLVYYDGELIKGCPVEFLVKADLSKVKLLTETTTIKLGTTQEVVLDTTNSGMGEVIVEVTSPSGELKYLTTVRSETECSGSFQPKEVGTWTIHVYFDEEEVIGSPVYIRVYDPKKAWMSGPEEGIADEMVPFKDTDDRNKKRVINKLDKPRYLDNKVERRPVRGGERHSVHREEKRPVNREEKRIMRQVEKHPVHREERRVVHKEEKRRVHREERHSVSREDYSEHEDETRAAHRDEKHPVYREGKRPLNREEKRQVRREGRHSARREERHSEHEDETRLVHRTEKRAGQRVERHSVHERERRPEQTGEKYQVQREERHSVYKEERRPKSRGQKVERHLSNESEEDFMLTFDEMGVEETYIADALNCSRAGPGEVTAKVQHKGKSLQATVGQTSGEEDNYTLSFFPSSSGEYMVHAYFNKDEISGSPKRVQVQDPGQILVTGAGIVSGVRGEETKFTVNATGVGGNIDVNIEVEGKTIQSTWSQIGSDIYEFAYMPSLPGHYTVKVLWNGRDVKGSPFSPKITDRSQVRLLDDLTDDLDENDHLALVCDKETTLRYDISNAGPGTFAAEVLAPGGRLPVSITKPNKDTVKVGFTAREEGDHYIHLYWSDVPLEKSPILAYCPGPILPVDHSKVIVTGNGCESARATVMTEFIIDGKKAGPGIPRVKMQGVKANVDIEMQAMKYDRYKCRYAATYPGAYLLYVWWSEEKVPGSPFKVNVTNKGHTDKVSVSGQGLRGGYVGQELRAVVDTTDAGNGEVLAECTGYRQIARCDKIDHRNGMYTLRIFPTEACKHSLKVTYDGEHVTGSPFTIPVGEPPDPKKVRVYGPGVEDGVIQKFESRFLVETYGAGAGQLAVRIRGPRGAFKVEMKRDNQNDRTIVCRYDPEEQGKYLVNVKWSGAHVPGSPFSVTIFETKEDLHKQSKATREMRHHSNNEDRYQWKQEI